MPNFNLAAMNVQQRVAFLDSVTHKLPVDDAQKASSLISFYGSRGYLSDPQTKLVYVLITKAEPELRDRTREQQLTNFSRIIEVFDTAERNERKNPKLRLGDKENKIELTIGKPGSANPGQVYVKHNGSYLGKVRRDGLFVPSTPTVPVVVLALLEQFSINPQKMMREYGFKTGSCCVCGRTLTDKDSIANGIGPICEGGYGF